MMSEVFLKNEIEVAAAGLRALAKENIEVEAFVLDIVSQAVLSGSGIEAPESIMGLDVFCTGAQTEGLSNKPSLFIPLFKNMNALESHKAWGAYTIAGADWRQEKLTAQQGED